MPAGLLDTTSHPPSARGIPSPSPSPAAATAGAAKGPGQDVSTQPLSKAPLSHAEPRQATAAAQKATAKTLAPIAATDAPQVPFTPAAVCQIPVSSATAADDRPQLQPSSSSFLQNDSTLAPITSAKPAAAVELPHIAVDPAAATAEAAGITFDTAAATAKAAVTTAEAAAASAASLEATAQDAAADIYSPIRSPPPSIVMAPGAPSVPTLASLPPPQLNPLPPPPQAAYQQSASIAPYATAEMAAWQQQQAYQGYYAGSYPYSDPTYGYAYSQMTQPHPSFGVAPSASVGVSAAQAPPGSVAPPRPPPLGPTSPPPKHPVSSKVVGSAASFSQPGLQAGQSPAAMPHANPAFPSAARPAAVTASSIISGE